MSLILAKMVFALDMALIDENLDWEKESHVHVQWWKPDLRMRFTPRQHAEKDT